MRLNVSPRVALADPVLQRELREHAQQVNLLTEGRIAAVTNAQVVPNPSEMGAIADFIRNPSPVIVNASLPDAYIVWGHVCLGDGAPGTWYEMRMPVYPYLFPDPNPPLFLDLFPGAVAAYSVSRKLKVAGSSYALQVRRSSDSTTQDIGFSSNEMDSASALSFVGAGNGDVTAVYNQVDGTNYIGASGSPRLIAGGALNTLGANNKPCLSLTASDYLTTSAGGSVPNFGTTMGVSGNAAFSIFAVYRKTTNTAGSLYGWGNQAVSLQAAGYYDDGSASVFAYAGGNSFVTSTPANNTHFLLSVFKSAGAINTTSAAYRNGVSVATTGHSTATPNISGSLPLEWGRWAGNAGGKLVGQLQELIVYPNDQSANRAAIEANIRAYYGI